MPDEYNDNAYKLEADSPTPLVPQSDMWGRIFSDKTSSDDDIFR